MVFRIDSCVSLQILLKTLLTGEKEVDLKLCQTLSKDDCESTKTDNVCKT